MRECDTIIEVGADDLSISQFLTVTHHKVVCVGPNATLEPASDTGSMIEHIRAPIEQVADSIGILGTLGVVALGLEINGAEGIESVLDLVRKCKTAVLECASNFRPAMDQLTYLVVHGEKHVLVKMAFDVSGSTIESSGKYPLRPKRLLYVLEGK